MYRCKSVSTMCLHGVLSTSDCKHADEGFFQLVGKDLVLESLSSCETSPGRLLGIGLLIASNTGFEAFHKAFLEGGGVGFLFYTVNIMPELGASLPGLKPFRWKNYRIGVKKTGLAPILRNMFIRKDTSFKKNQNFSKIFCYFNWNLQFR